MTSAIHQALIHEVEATTRGLQQQVSHLQQDLDKLAKMVNGSSDEAFDAYQYAVWTQGNAARAVTEIASLLSRQQALQEALHLLNRSQEQEEANSGRIGS
jgi:hypothetical protein